MKERVLEFVRNNNIALRCIEEVMNLYKADRTKRKAYGQINKMIELFQDDDFICMLDNIIETESAEKAPNAVEVKILISILD